MAALAPLTPIRTVVTQNGRRQWDIDLPPDTGASTICAPIVLISVAIALATSTSRVVESIQRV